MMCHAYGFLEHRFHPCVTVAQKRVKKPDLGTLFQSLPAGANVFNASIFPIPDVVQNTNSTVTLNEARPHSYIAVGSRPLSEL